MPQEYTATNPQTGETVRWDGKAWTPVPSKAAPFERDVMAGMGFDPAKVESAGGSLGQWKEVGKEAVSGIPAWLSRTAKDPFHIADPLHAMASGIENAIKEKNPGKLMGALSNVAMGMEAPEAGSAVARSGAAASRGLLDVGENFRQRALQEHETNLAKLNEEYETKVQEHGKATMEDEANHRLKVQQAKDDYAAKVAENERKKIEASAKQTGAETKKNALTTQPRSGPVYQRLSGMADQIATKDVPKLDRDVRTAQNNGWSAFRMAIGDKPGAPKMVEWNPVQNAVSSAETNILQGSPENIAIFRNILHEGVNPVLEEASVFRGTAGALENIFSSKHMTESGRARLLESIGEESAAKLRTSGLPTGDAVSIPFDDARGYYTELNEKLYKNRSVPGDVRRALKSVQDAAEAQVKKVIPSNQLGTYSRLKSDWAQYMGDFYDPDGPLYQLKNAATSDGRLNLITGSKGANIIEALGRYTQLNPNVVGIAGRLRSVMKQLRELPSAAPRMPEEVRPPRFPAAPKPRELPTRPTVEPLDVTKARVEALQKMPHTWGQLRPYQAAIPYYWPRLAIQKVIAEVLSHPAVRNWIAGNK